MLKGRLGLDSADIPQGDRFGVLWLERGRLYTEDGTLHFATAGNEDLRAGDYALPFQMLNCILLGPGATVTHDALRVLASHGTALCVIGEGGVRFYASMPAGPDRSARARRHATLWADDAGGRLKVARRMYAWRLGEIVPSSDIAVLRGIEGARVKRMYELLAQQHGIRWQGRRYDRHDPDSADRPNQAINHVSTAMKACAEVAVAIAGAIPQLGFIHEESGIAFALDVADLYRESHTVPIAFRAVRAHRDNPGDSFERAVRRSAAQAFRREALVGKMVERITEILDVDDGSGHA